MEGEMDLSGNSIREKKGQSERIKEEKGNEKGTKRDEQT